MSTHITSDIWRRRRGYTYDENGVGTKNADPFINWRHIDGPLLYTSEGRMHWLTLLERAQMFLGFLTIKDLDAKYRIKS